MVISHKYKYIFVQLDHTGSTAIAKELCENYAGEPILWKHARYCDFLRIATTKQEEYFAFSGIRNSLDVLVSVYFKLKFNSLKRFSKGKRGERGVTLANLKQYNFIKKEGINFADFFKNFYAHKIFNEWKTKGFEHLNYVYRFENFQQGFSKILKIIGIRQKRPLPFFRKTPHRKKDFASYYPKEIQGRARIVFRKYMRRWDYQFPENWSQPSYWERFFIAPLLNLRYGLSEVFHFFIDHPTIYRKVYRRSFGKFDVPIDTPNRH